MEALLLIVSFALALCANGRLVISEKYTRIGGWAERRFKVSNFHQLTALILRFSAHRKVTTEVNQ
jgi:hypothetical protein